jgi:hypothetical protein
MWEHDCGCLPVCVEGASGAPRVIGMLTDRDICMAACFQGRNALSVPPRLRPDVPKGQSAQGTRTHDVERARKFIEFVMQKASSCRIHGPPHSWHEGDQSWNRGEDHRTGS